MKDFFIYLRVGVMCVCVFDRARGTRVVVKQMYICKYVLNSYLQYWFSQMFDC